MRITRVSPPELALELPGPYLSIRATRRPRVWRWRAVHTPKTPDPTTATSKFDPAAARELPACAFALLATPAATAAPTNVRRLTFGFTGFLLAFLALGRTGFFTARA